MVEVMGEMMVEVAGLGMAEKMTQGGEGEAPGTVTMTEVKMEEMVAMALVTANAMEVMANATEVMVVLVMVNATEVTVNVTEVMANATEVTVVLVMVNATDRKSTRLNSSHRHTSRMPSSA